MKKGGKRLNADERPLFAPYHSVHKTKKDKEKNRQKVKENIKKMY